MTRNQWTVESREQRIKRRNLWLSKPATNLSGAMNAALKELYGYIYLPKQQVTIDLVRRYKNKLDPEYMKKHWHLVEIWKPEAKTRADEMFRALLYSKNPFLST